MLQTGPPDRHQRALSAVLYAAGPSTDPLSGSTSVLTGGAALALIGARGAPATPVDVLVDAPRAVMDKAYVRTLSTRRWPPTIRVRHPEHPPDPRGGRLRGPRRQRPEPLWNPDCSP
ncbi:hypothetical protein [Streptomyces sp. NPDC051219]|uniref:hypothetical protein n=1 Tax=Streptomyces sp. NPDC051219 TaxID=3155283 RepID=UPI00341DF544